MNKKEFVCIACPNSCKLTVWEENGEILVDGASCKRGEEHGRNEYTDPKRMLTATVAISGSTHPRLAVISSREVPKDKMAACLEELYSIKLKAPVRKGDVVVQDICGTGVDIVASRSMKAH